MSGLKPLSIMLSLIAGSAIAASTLAARGGSKYIGYEQARPILETLKQALPQELQSLPAQNTAAAWDQWVGARDAQIRARLDRGDEDSLVNFLLFGTSFTSRRRLTLEFLAEVGRKQATMGSSVSPEGAELLTTVRGRAEDLVHGMQAPGGNERLNFARHFLERKAYTVAGPADPGARGRSRDYLLSKFERVLNEQTIYAEALERARKNGDASEEFAERSRLYRERGLSSDTSLLPDFAIAETLAAIKARELLAAGSVRRVAIVGPGLDFSDKQD